MHSPYQAIVNMLYCFQPEFVRVYLSLEMGQMACLQTIHTNH